MAGVIELGGALRAYWTPPADYEGPEVESYDVRYIETAEDASDDENWTLVEEAWESEEGGERAYRIEDLTVGTEYGVQVRAVNRSGPGPWSKTATGTPWTPVFCEKGAVADAEENPGLMSDCELLLRSRDKLAGSATLNWRDDAPMSEWEGVTLSGTPERVTRLELQGKGSGRRDSGGAVVGVGAEASVLVWEQSERRDSGELGKLTNLERLYLHDNDLSGEIPYELDGLRKLTHLLLLSNGR